MKYGINLILLSLVIFLYNQYSFGFGESSSSHNIYSNKNMDYMETIALSPDELHLLMDQNLLAESKCSLVYGEFLNPNSAKSIKLSQIDIRVMSNKRLTELSNVDLKALMSQNKIEYSLILNDRNSVKKIEIDSGNLFKLSQILNEPELNNDFNIYLTVNDEIINYRDLVYNRSENMIALVSPVYTSSSISFVGDEGLNLIQILNSLIDHNVLSNIIEQREV